MTTRRKRDRKPTFSFGENWLKYVDEMPPAAADRMSAYVASWLGPDLTGLRIVDIGSGQGLTSLVAHSLGADVVSIDIDPGSVTATTRLWKRAGSPETWKIYRGSILDRAFVADLGAFDVAVSWGALHHTGDLWNALTSSASLVCPGGRLWVALYHKTAQSGRSLNIKRFYNALPRPGKVIFRSAYGGAKVAKHLVVYRSLRRLREYGAERGMSWRRDVEDWLGGLPYEVSSPGEVLAHLRPLGFTLQRLADALAEGGNDVYLFMRNSDSDPGNC